MALKRGAKPRQFLTREGKGPELKGRKALEALLSELTQRRARDPLMKFEPFEAQRRFARAVLYGEYDENGYFGANRSGKTLIGAYIGATLARFGYPDDSPLSPRYVRGADSDISVRDRATSGWVSALDFPTSRDVVQPRYFDNGFVGPGGTEPFIPPHEIEEWRAADQILKLKNGSLIGFKCLRGDQEVLLADGTWRRIDQIGEGARVSVRSHFGRAGMRDRHAEVTTAGYSGNKALIRLSLHGNREIVCTPEHRIFDGLRWREAGTFRKGQTIPYYGVPEPENPEVMDFPPLLLGALLGDGCLRDKQIRFACENPTVLAWITAAVPQGFKVTSYDGRTHTISVPRAVHANWLLTWLRTAGVWGKGARDKCIPDAVFRAPNWQVWEFLVGLFITDGQVRSDRDRISLTTTSERMAFQVQRLLDRFQIKSGVYYVKTHDCWHVNEMRATPLRVKAVTDAGTAPTYDLAVPGPRCFMVAGVPVHNSADSGRAKYQGVEKDWVHEDEEHPESIHNEIVIRVGTRKLNVFITATLLPPEGTVGGVTWLFPRMIQPWKMGQSGKRFGVFNASIYDNPHIPREEIERLEARFPPESVQGRIRLGGELIPGLAGARVYSSFDRSLNVPKEQPPVSLRRPLVWCWDFNVEPMVTLVGQFDRPHFRIYNEIVLDEGNIAEMCEAFRRLYPSHYAEVIIHGDASGHDRSHQTRRSSYAMIMNCMASYPAPLRMRVPNVNPSVDSRVQAVNRACRDEDGRRLLQVGAACTELIDDLEQVVSDGRGGIKKVTNRKDSYFRRTHMSDALGYWLSYEAPVVALPRRSRSSSSIPRAGYHGV